MIEDRDDYTFIKSAGIPNDSKQDNDKIKVYVTSDNGNKNEHKDRGKESSLRIAAHSPSKMSKFSNSQIQKMVSGDMAINKSDEKKPNLPLNI